MKTIRFTANVVLKDCRVGTPQEESYTVDQVVTLPDDKANRWLRRNKAVEALPLSLEEDKQVVAAPTLAAATDSQPVTEKQPARSKRVKLKEEEMDTCRLPEISNTGTLSKD